MVIKFNNIKIIKWSAIAAKIVAIVTFLNILQPFLLNSFDKIKEEFQKNPQYMVFNFLILIVMSVVQALVFWGYSKLVEEYLKKETVENKKEKGKN